MSEHYAQPPLAINDVSLQYGQRYILNGVSLRFCAGGLHALVGPSGCGKSTLLKAITTSVPSTGSVSLGATVIRSKSDCTGRISYVSQFNYFHDTLCVRQMLDYAIRLFADKSFDREWFSRVCALIGIDAIMETQIKHLSGGQLRRLSLAEALIPKPAFILCDEVTSGLDPQAELEIIKTLKSLLPMGITTICVIHNLTALRHFDSITVLEKGCVRYSGGYLPIKHLLEDDTGFYSKLSQLPKTEPLADAGSTEPDSPRKTTSDQYLILRQTYDLLSRRIAIFASDKTQLKLFLLLTFGFPVLVVIFAWGGLPQMESFSLAASANPLAQMQNNFASLLSALSVGSLISALIMFQVILLTLMGSNSGAKEISGERQILEKEKLFGLNILSYVASKSLFMLMLSILQGVWMAVFVKWFCKFPGELFPQASVLVLSVFAMSMSALAISALLSSPDKSSLVATYLVGFQLPLSGIVLALPQLFSEVIRPFIVSFWGWSGYLSALKDTRAYDAVIQGVNSEPLPVSTSLAALGLYAIVGFFLSLYGTERSFSS